ncbi:hypothetical protein FRUB_01603 [Fimbriiglobus ruber]|uniref:Uncharacterized protein n=1 Tax=Fimbriiglobus ruber TaxID=1908690 RepID=A0A225DV94_9BACT|nr:hypothetical protein FRUB_01603 [Fimbriiglobus ruber]
MPRNPSAPGVPGFPPGSTSGRPGGAEDRERPRRPVPHTGAGFPPLRGGLT